MARRKGRLESTSLTFAPVSVPEGTVLPFAGTTAPTGWLVCDGSQVSRTTYATLFAQIGTVHGEGDGSTTFHLPDYRGTFLRGSDDMGSGAAGVDPDAGSRTAANTGGDTGATVGSKQGHAVIQMNGDARVSTFAGGNSRILANGVFTNKNNFNSSFAGGGGGSNTGTTYEFDNSLAVDTSTENRPTNANINYIIKV